MPDPQTLLAVMIAAAVLFGGTAAYSSGIGGRKAAERMRATARRVAPREARQRLGVPRRDAAPQPGFIQGVVERLHLLSSKEAKAGRLLLIRAGIRGDGALAKHLFLRVTMPVAFGIGVLVDAHLLHLLPIGPNWVGLSACVATVVGFYAPTIMLKNKVTRRQAELRKSLPDGMDLLVICVESGASINESFARVGRELARGHTALAEEFSITAAELSFLPMRRVALENLLERTGLDAVRGLVTTMLQAERFGTPIAQSLRVLSAEFRDRRMMAAEEKAAKLPVLLTVPMMIFILPVLFIVLLGPAVLSILDAMAKS